MTRNEEKLEIKVTNQSFAEAGGINVYPNLEMGEVVTASLSETYHRSIAINHLNNGLKEIAKDKGFTHVFGVDYEQNPQKPFLGSVHFATGTGYRPKQ